ncbi:polymerase [Rio Claro virus]|uniref:RNA-directed RNA polymerase L n=1 Tax=Rio Claro virus TaxID=2848418 RepID=I1T368_9VIRU|nr:polymerase [Rio Claro virus]AEL29685.1 polymerase [Rio Claro virus]
MDELIKRLFDNPEGFQCGDLRHYDSTVFNLELPEFEVREITTGIEIDLQPIPHSAVSAVGSTLQEKYEIRAIDVPNLVHNMSVGHLCPDTDRQFSSVFPIKNDGFDHLSPDLIIRMASGNCHVIEFTTNRGGVESCHGAAMSKISKYEIPCRIRSQDSPVTLSVIAIHRDGVWSNIPLEEEDVDEMTYRFRLAVDIFETISRIAPALVREDPEVHKTRSDMATMLNGIKMRWDRTTKAFPMFKKEVFDNFHSQPADEDYVSRIISKELERSQEDLKRSSFMGKSLSLEERLSANLQECCEAINKYIETYESNQFMRDKNDPKSTVQIPSWVTIPGDKGKGLGPLRYLTVESEHPMGRIWKRVAECAYLETIDRMYDDPEAELEFAMSGSTERAEERNKYHRVRVNLSPEEEEYAGMLGIRGKKYRDYSSAKEARERGKKSFSIHHDISELEEFITKQDFSIFQVSDEIYSPLDADIELRAEASSIHQPKLFSQGQNNEFIDNHIRFLKTPLGSWTQMVSLIGAELSASVKQHVKPNCYVIKRLLDSAIYLLIKPTSSKSHIFVSFAVEKSCLHSFISRSNVFKSTIDCGDLLVTDFVSFKLSKLTNLCKTNSLVEACANFWVEAYGFPPWETFSILSKDRSGSATDATTMIKLGLLTLLEDKAATEELQTMMRYIIMEGFVSQPEFPKPHKMTEKLLPVLRSELQVFLTHRIFMAMRRISSRPFGLSKRGGQIFWTSLFNPLTLSEVRELQPVISACYNGYFKNKEEETEPTALSKMYKKIIELEHLCPEDDRFLGMDDPEYPNTHEFSRSYLRQCVDHGKQLLTRIHGSNFMRMIDEQIIREVSMLTIERLATLKATSNFNENWYVYKDVQDKNYTRDKLLVKMSEYADQGSSLAIQKFEECMSKIEDRGAMNICLFKKQQHGGLREIYVMGAEERIVQSVVEAIAKSIGRFFPSDTLCNPSNKMKIPETHGLRARKHCKGSVWTCATSDDAKKWNQGHFVTKFAMMLCSFTEKHWWPVIIRGCSMFTCKRMMMNLKYLDILFKHRELPVQDEFVQTLHKAFLGEVTVPWMKEGVTYLTTKTGMMQGILHFTSSLLHTIHQEFIRSLTPKIFDLKVAPETSYKMVVDMMQGSDDSSMIISFPATDEMSISRCKVASAICFRMKRNLGVYLGIYPSPKSTSNTDHMMEYNSEFFFHSQHVRPTIRWIAASCSLPEVETLVARQEEASNLLTSVTEGGGSFALAACVQHSQCTIHYMLMGMGVSELFYEYRKAVKRWKDPGIGFFLFDNPYAAGLGGFRYNLYRAIRGTSLQKLYAYFMKKVRGHNVTDNEDGIAEPEACSVSPGGALILSSSLKWGSREKFFKLRDRLKIPEDWLDQINKMPDILYRAPQTGHEIKLRIAEKVHSPGVVSSLSSGNSVAKVMASSVYFLSAAIFEDSGRPEFQFFENSKYSLLSRLAQYKGFEGRDDISPDDLLFLFPNVEELSQLDSVVFNRGLINYAYRSNQREATQTKVVIFDECHNLKVSAEKMISDKWFGTSKSRIGRTGFQHEWDKLKTIIPWLCDTASETLEKSPLANHIQIKNFFARMEGRARSVRITGAPVKKRSGVSKIAMVIRDNFVRCGYLRDIEDLSGAERTSSSEVSKHVLYCILHGPYSDEQRKERVIKALRELPEISIKDSDRKTKSNIIGIMQHWVSHDSGTMELIEKTGAGVIGGFIYPQKPYKDDDGKIKYYGDGSWRGIMDGVQVQINITSKKGMPSHISSVVVHESAAIWELGNCIRAWAEDVHVMNSVDFSNVSRGKHLSPRFWLHDFRPYGADKPYGAPVYIVRERMTDLVTRNESAIKLKVRNSTVNLYIVEQGRDMHILSYTAHDSDLNHLSITNSKDERVRSLVADLGSKEPTRSWFLCESLHFSCMKIYLDLAYGVVSIPTIDSERFREIIQLCTESALRTQVGSSFKFMPGSSEAPIAIDLDAMINLMLDDMDPMGFQEAAKDIADDLSISYMTDKFDFTDIDLFGPAHHREISNLKMTSHPLMSNFVTGLINMSSRKEVRKVIETGECKSKNEEGFRLLFKALGRDPDSVRVEFEEHVEIPDDLSDMLG